MDYAEARMHARFGNRPGSLAWQRLQGITQTEEFLEAAKRAGLGHWIAGIEPRTALHRVELVLRDRLRGLIRETAQWLPDDWKKPVSWTVQLVDLPALAHLARGGHPLHWMKDDTIMAAYLGAAAMAPGDAMLNAAQREQVFKAVRARTSPGVSAGLKEWISLWQATWPSGSERASAGEIVKRAESHLARFAACKSGEPAEVLREEFDRELRREFRRNAFLPGSVLAYLAMQALDFERVRALLVDRMQPAGNRTRPAGRGDQA